MWNQLHNDSKDLILSSNGSKPQRPTCKPSFKVSKSTSDTLTVSQLHELLEPLGENESDTPEEVEESTILVNFTQASDFAPGDIRKVLSVPTDSKHRAKKTQANKTITDKHDLVVDCINY